MENFNQVKLPSFDGQDFFIGIDVHRKNWVVSIRYHHMELKTFSMNPSPQQLFHHLSKNYPNGNYYSVYEAGFCGYWIHRNLHELGINNIVVNPADIPTTNKEKDRRRDPIDSRKLARELENRSLTGIYIPSEKQQALRSVSRLYYHTSKDRARIKNRIKSYLHFHGIEIPRVDEISHWSGKFINWLRNIPFEQQEDHYFLDRLIYDLEQKRKETLELLRYMRVLCKDISVIKYLRSIYGIGFITSFTLYTELMDMHRFNSMDHLASFIGLVPSVSSSDERENVRGLTYRYSKYLRNQLIESAWVAVRLDPALTHCFSQYIKRMSKQKAIIRIAKKLLNRVRYVWLNQKEYVTGVLK
ncbi:MAG: IS110 family RNA-guided transposase [Promethearchaeota archaeon]|jgi:transposase